MHFHVLLRLDGVDPDDRQALAPPPAGITVDDLDAAVHAATRQIATGELRSIKDGKYRRVLPERVDEYVREQVQRQEAA